MQEKKCWLPVLYERELTALPKSVKLCGERLVLWRDKTNAVHALKDLCIHRGTALSLGTVRGNEIVCPYHGWSFNGSGACTFIPQLEDQNKIPEKAKVNSYRCQTKFGIIWVALEEPMWDLPEIPELSSKEWHIIETGPFPWQANASRQVENFTDFAHFPFVHPGLLGDPSRPMVPEHTVVTEDHVLLYEVHRPEATNTNEFPIFGNPDKETPMRRNSYQLHLPFTIVLTIRWDNTPNKMIYFFSSQPVSDNECIGYCIVAKNYGEDDGDTIRKFEEVIFDQDKRIVESQRPEQVPFNLADELHLKFDAVALSYRRQMKKMGFKNE
jgi:phenylpropionate dioxygenase-like ring-hydroxylating dioxygenase large terminal subunit